MDWNKLAFLAGWCFMSMSMERVPSGLFFMFFPWCLIQESFKLLFVSSLLNFLNSITLIFNTTELTLLRLSINAKSNGRLLISIFSMLSEALSWASPFPPLFSCHLWQGHFPGFPSASSGTFPGPTYSFPQLQGLACLSSSIPSLGSPWPHIRTHLNLPQVSSLKSGLYRKLPGRAWLRCRVHAESSCAWNRAFVFSSVRASPAQRQHFIHSFVKDQTSQPFLIFSFLFFPNIFYRLWFASTHTCYYPLPPHSLISYYTHPKSLPLSC